MKSCSNQCKPLVSTGGGAGFGVAGARGRSVNRAGRLAAVLLASTSIMPVSSAFAGALPENGSVTAGAGAISSDGTTMTIRQDTHKLAIDWQSFSIGAGNTVRFEQPSATAAALNRVTGGNPSEILGSLQANGRVFLTNPAGITFGATAEINVGGLVASTLNISNEDFEAGNYVFEGDSAAAIANSGRIQATGGGPVALVAARVVNTGEITANAGSVAIGAGRRVRLDLGGPVQLEVEEAAVDALIEQGGAIRADDGRVVMEARAAGDVAATVINHTGVTQARSMTRSASGAIYLMGDMQRGRIRVGGTLDASAPNGGDGGFVETSAARVDIADDVQVTTAAPQGRTGTWLIDPTDIVIGEGGMWTGAGLSASLANNNMIIETVAGGFQAGHISVDDPVTWASGNSLELRAHGSIFLNSVIDASGGDGGSLILRYGLASADGGSADYDIRHFTHGARVRLQEGLNFTTQKGAAGDQIVYHVITRLGEDGDQLHADRFTLQGLANPAHRNLNFAIGDHIDASATSGWTAGPTASNFVGFFGIGAQETFFFEGGNSNNPYTGRAAGLGNEVQNLFTARGYPWGGGTIGPAGLFASTQDAELRDFRIVDVNLRFMVDTEAKSFGALVGYAQRTDIHNSFSSGSIGLRHPSGNNGGLRWSGGLVGMFLGGTISDSGSTVSMRGGNQAIGGLVGQVREDASVLRSWASGDVIWNGNSQGSHHGGLVGRLDHGRIIESYATGNVTGRDGIGGLVGVFGATIGRFVEIRDSYSTGNVTDATNVNGLGGLVGGLATTLNPVSTPPPNIYNSFSMSTLAVSGGGDLGRAGGLAGRNTSNLGQYDVLDRIAFEGQNFWLENAAYQYPVAFLNQQVDGATAILAADFARLDTFLNAGWDISAEFGGTSTWFLPENAPHPMLRAHLTPILVSTSNVTRVYDGTAGGAFAISASGLPAGMSLEDLGTPSFAHVTNVNPGVAPVLARDLSIPDALWGGQRGFDLAMAPGTLTITPRPITVTAQAASKELGRPDPVFGFTVGGLGLVGGDRLNGALAREAGERAGSYPIGLGSLDNPNYQISFTPAQLTIVRGAEGGSQQAQVAVSNAIRTVLSGGLLGAPSFAPPPPPPPPAAPAAGAGGAVGGPAPGVAAAGAGAGASLAGFSAPRVGSGGAPVFASQSGGLRLNSVASGGAGTAASPTESAAADATGEGQPEGAQSRRGVDAATGAINFDVFGSGINIAP